MKRYERYYTMTWMRLVIRNKTDKLCSITEDPLNPVSVLSGTNNFE